ncbi:MAG: hypothetical protein NUV93_06050 [Firmicutes bacterium]|nr:hypothetical protein [Bacillota bacterium]
MTHFLACGFLRECLAEIAESAVRLDRLLETGGRTVDDEARVAARFMAARSARAVELLDSMSCEPLVWTGEGTTDEVIRRLERLLAAEESTRSN